MNEAETRAELVDPALKEAGWGGVSGSRIRREFQITDGRLQGGGQRAKKDIADYVLEYHGKMLAVIEAKRRDLPDTEGLGQAKSYAMKLGVPYAYSTNGDGIYEINMVTADEDYIAAYPTPDELWAKTFQEQNEWRDRFGEVDFDNNGGQWSLRYYKYRAIDSILEAIAAGKDRILLTLATGTGKTSVAAEVSWKLYHSRWNLQLDGQRRPRILFLADRNILADQAYNAFSSFPDNALVRISPNVIRDRGEVPTNGNIFFTIFQTFMTGRDDEGNPLPNFGEYNPDFFDFIIIDECHRGGANDESNWRGIMDYFSPAVQLGLTATPKREGNVDTYDYFGEPVFIYSLKDGINDGFLTPFKVRQILTTLDDYTYDPSDDVLEGEVEVGEHFEEEDFNRVIEIPEREKKRVDLFMQEIDQTQKTLVFCATQKHALDVCCYINQIKESTDPLYCVRVAADDGALGEQHLRTFQDNQNTIPTILTTSQKLSTGVDARNIRNIVLMRPINTMIEFKQIIGRGTRLYDGKDYFTIYDFVRASDHFDKEWDGEPIDPIPPPPGPEAPRDPDDSPVDPDGPQPRRRKVKITLADGKERNIEHIASTIFMGPDGMPMSATEFIERLYGELPALFKDEDELRKLWGQPDTRKRLLEELVERGYGLEQLNDIKAMINAQDSDVFDVLAYIAYAEPPITREERVNKNKDTIVNLYDDKLSAFIEFVLGQYEQEGVGELDQEKLPALLEIKYTDRNKALVELGGVDAVSEAFVGFQKHLYMG